MKDITPNVKAQAKLDVGASAAAASIVEAGTQARRRGDYETAEGCRLILGSLSAIIAELAHQREPTGWRGQVLGAALDCARLVPSARWIELERLRMWGRA